VSGARRPRSPERAGGRDEGRLTHLDAQGRARMVDVTAKPVTRRLAEARCVVRARPDALAALAGSPEAVGDARSAGVLGAKLTSQLIPLCHPLLLDRIEVAVSVGAVEAEIRASAAVDERTGVEMEALTACAMAALALVSALVGSDPTAHIDDLTLWHKSGGRSGTWERDERTGAVAHRDAP
jgi:cyclic pyranopterin phosphate synthase